MILTYDDNNQCDHVVSALNDLDWNYAGRVHDMEGKPHYHIVVLFKNGRKCADVAKDIGIDARWLRAWDSKKKALRYLCHRDDSDKYQYTTDTIFGNLADDAIKACNVGQEQIESNVVCEIVALLDSYQERVTYSFFIAKCAELGYWSVLRRMGNLACKLVDEHNQLWPY